ncbi:MAG: dihydrolipoamide acetyltransferase family protein [Chloroflexota bacterium]
MAVAVVMPRLGWDAEEGSLVEWLKKDGDLVEVGEIVCTVEGDKSVNEVESLDRGILRIPPDSPQAGVKVPVGTVLAYLVQVDEQAPFETGLTPLAPSPSPMERGKVAAPGAACPPLAISNGEGQGVRPSPLVTVSAIAPVTRRDEPPISPRARRIAAELGVRWADLKGSGRTGRIVERDVQAAAQTLTPTLSQREREMDEHALPDIPASPAQPIPVSPRPPVDGSPTPMSGVRRIIARRMAESARTVAPVTLTTEADATDLAALRNRMKDERAGTDEVVPSYNDLLVKIVAVALGDHPRLNASLADDAIVEHPTVNVGIAVDTERGLLVPVVRGVGDKSIHQIAVESSRLIERARSSKISADELDGGTFTITNLGPFEIDTFTPMINLPECAILGVGRIVARPVVVDDASERIAVRKRLALSLTFDHRVVDGAPAARFLQRVKFLVEHPTLWIIR